MESSKSFTCALSHTATHAAGCLRLDLVGELAQAATAFDADPSIGCIVLTGAGGIVEVQATAEEDPFSEDQFLDLMPLPFYGKKLAQAV